MVRLHRDILEPLDEWIARQPEPLSRPDAIRKALRGWLSGLGSPLTDKPNRKVAAQRPAKTKAC
jgi:hypothetical protein